MKRIKTWTLLFCLPTLAFADTQPKDRLGYTMGYRTGAAMKHEIHTDVNPDRFVDGFKDGYNDHTPQMAHEDMNSAMDQFIKGQEQASRQNSDSIAVANAKSEVAFLKKNKKKHNVVTLPSGLQYEIIHEGHGSQPTMSDHVTVNYEGSLLSGRVFDSTYQRGKPATFALSGVIPGWQQALPLMSVGSTWMLYVPSSLAYGTQGAGHVIPPNAMLIFKIELLGVSP